MFDVTFLRDFRKKLDSVSRSVHGYGQYFKALALVDSYNQLIRLADERLNTHPEVARVPELKTILINHLTTQYTKHIDVRNEKIFNPNILGSEFALRQWQDAGYRTRARRTSKNYYKRLQYWKSIYDNQPMKVPISTSNENMGTATLKKRSSSFPRTGDDIFGGVQGTLFYEVRVKDRSGSIITYEDVIRKRNLGFGAATNTLIPFWVVFNYGSDVGIQPGYPATPGLHFVDAASPCFNSCKVSSLYICFKNI